MKRILIDLGRVILSLAIIAGAVFIFRSMGRKGRPKLDRPPPQVMVEVMPAVSQNGNFEFEVDGVVVPFREVNVAAEVGGRVTYKSPTCRAGEAVHEGDLLFRIDDKEYQLEINRLNETVEQAVGSIEELEVDKQSALDQIQLAEEELKIRQRELARFDNPSVFSRSEIDVAKRNELLARNAIQSRKDQLDMLKSRERRLASLEQTARSLLERAQLDLDRCEVRSRVSGVIVSESVQQEGFVQKGGVLMMIRDTSRMEVRCNLRMQQLQWLWESSHAKQTVANTSPDDSVSEVAAPPSRTQAGYQFPKCSTKILYELNDVQYIWQGELARYADSGVDQRTRMVPCIVEVDGPEKVTRLDDGARSASAPPTLLSGMFVKVRIQAQLPRPLLKLPVTAVAPGGDVWIVEQKKLKRAHAEVLHADEAYVLVEQSPALKGALIVTSPLVSPIEGMAANIFNPDGDSGDTKEGQAPPSTGSNIARNIESDEPGVSSSGDPKSDSPAIGPVGGSR